MGGSRVRYSQTLQNMALFRISVFTQHALFYQHVHISIEMLTLILSLYEVWTLLTNRCLSVFKEKLYFEVFKF